MPSGLERAVLCRQYEWRVLPWELDNLHLDMVKTPLVLLRIYDTFHKFGQDVKGVSDQELELIAYVDELRNIVGSDE